MPERMNPEIEPVEPEVKEPFEMEPISETRKKAEELYKRHEHEILNAWFGDGEPPDGAMTHNAAIPLNLSRFSEEELAQYWGHGVTRGGDIERLIAVLRIAKYKTIKGWCAEVGGQGGYGAWKSGSFLVLSPRGEQLMIRRDNRPILHEDESWEANIGAIVVNDYFYPLVDELRQMYPDVNFVKANELSQYIQKAEELDEDDLPVEPLKENE